MLLQAVGASRYSDLLNLSIGIHPTTIAQSFQRAAGKAVEFLEEMSTPVDLNDRESLLRAAGTSLNSKVSPSLDLWIAAEKVLDRLAILFHPRSHRRLRRHPSRHSLIFQRRLERYPDSQKGWRDHRRYGIGGRIGIESKRPDECGRAYKDGEGQDWVDSIPAEQSKTRCECPCSLSEGLALIGGQMDNQIVVNDYRQMDKILKEERQYLLNLCKRIKKTGCNVLLVQKSILRDAVTDLSLHFLAKLKIMVIKDIERDEIEFISKSTGCKPVADIEAFTEDKLGYAELIEESGESEAPVVRITGVKNPGKTVSVVCTGANQLVLEESERSMHDALCVVRCLVKKRCVIFLFHGVIAHTSQSSDSRRRSTRDTCFPTLDSIRSNSERQGSVLFPSFRRGTRDHPNYTRRECWSEPDSDRH